MYLLLAKELLLFFFLKFQSPSFLLMSCDIHRSLLELVHHSWPTLPTPNLSGHLFILTHQKNTFAMLAS